MKFFVPGKTFLVGEYAVLLDGPALGIATKPYFDFDILTDINEVDIDINRILTEKNFHIDSPVGLWTLKNNKKFNIYFNDAYQSKGVQGGFGRSTAEYFAAITSDLMKYKKSFFDIRKEYQDLHQKSTVKPSGIDLAFQYFGSITLADPKINFYQTFDWNFKNLDFFIISTGLKIATHEHLAEINLKQLHGLPELSHSITQVFAENKQLEFIESMGEWCQKLEEKGLTHLHTLHLKQQLEKNKDILLAKPCGALGADVMIVFFEAEKYNAVLSQLQIEKLIILAGSDDLATGFGSQIKNYGVEYVDRSLSPI